MRVWFISFILLFGAAELLQWMRHFSLPLPIFILGGVFLAIASNYDKLSNLPFHPDYEEPELPQQEVPLTKSLETKKLTTKKRTAHSISFEIRKPFKPSD